MHCTGTVLIIYIGAKAISLGNWVGTHSGAMSLAIFRFRFRFNINALLMGRLMCCFWRQMWIELYYAFIPAIHVHFISMSTYTQVLFSVECVGIVRTKIITDALIDRNYSKLYLLVSCMQS